MKYMVLAQYRHQDKYNDFIGKYYHFPKKYLNFFPEEPFEFLYFEPAKQGKGEYFGAGLIKSNPVKDKTNDGFYFIEISKQYNFSQPVKGPLEDKSHYNPQNAVRKITEKDFENICLLGGINFHFEADANLMDVLGEKLIASEKVGIFELMKNSFDAQAKNCTVRIEKVDSLPEISHGMYKYPDLDGPVICIEDDGIGMDLDTIRNGWLRPASIIKTNVKERLKQERYKALESGNAATYDIIVAQLKKEYKGRIPLGEKGVGRFAVHRLGRFLILKTKIKENDYTYVLKIDWDKFKSGDSQTDLSSIGVSISKEDKDIEFHHQKSGTKLIIYGGRAGFSWDEKKITDLNKSILQLKTPPQIKTRPKYTKQKITQFDVKFTCPQLPNLDIESIIDQYNPVFHLTGIVDNEGIIDYELEFTPPKNIPMTIQLNRNRSFDLKSCNQEYWENPSFPNEIREPTCGEFLVDLKVWYRQKTWIDGPDGKSLLEYLDNYGGIDIYRDGLNVFSAAQGKDSDWLGLSRKQIKQAWRISYYHIIGSVEIDQTKNFDLIDKTNREGMIENQAAIDFKTLIVAIIEGIIQTKYSEKRDWYNDIVGDIIRNPKTLGNYALKSAKIISLIKDSYSFNEDPFNLNSVLGDEEQKITLMKMEKALKNLQKSMIVLKESRDLLTEQAGFGLAIAVSIHEIGKIASNFYYSINEMLKKGIDREKLEELKSTSIGIRTELRRMSPLRAVRNEKKREFSIKKAINYVIDVYSSRIEKKEIQIKVEGEDFKVFARYGSITQVVSNIIDNSIYWLSVNSGYIRKILIKVNSSYRYVVFSDNGPGIDELILPNIFEPGYSLREPASGLGLYIAKYYMQELNGDIRIATSQERLAEMSGAQFTIDFEKVIKR